MHCPLPQIQRSPERIEYKLLSLTYKVLTTTQPSYLHNLISHHSSASSQHSLFIFGHTRSSIHIIFSANRPFLPVCGINSQLPFVNHALISPMLHHPVLWVALPASVPSTHHFHHSLPLQSFTPGLKLSFSAIPSHRSDVTYLFFFRTNPRIPGTVYRYFWAYPFLLSSLPVIHCCCSVL